MPKSHRRLHGVSPGWWPCPHGLALLGGLLPMVAAHAQLAVPPLASASAPLVFRGVTVIDVQSGRRVSEQTVVVSGTRIRTVGGAGAVPVPPGARVIDARGKYLIPGLWDMHVHPQGYVDIAYPLLVATGVTGIRDAGSNVPLDTLRQWKGEIRAGTRVGPRLLVSGPAIDEADPGQTTVLRKTGPASHFVSVPLAAARRVIDSLHAAGADFIKTYSMSREMYFAVTAAARRVGIRVGGHLPENRLDGRDASDSGATLLDHVTGLLDDRCGEYTPDSANAIQCAAAAQRFRRNHTWVTILAEFGIDSLTGQSKAAADTYFTGRARRYLPASSLDRPRDRAPDASLSFYEPGTTTDFGVAATSNIRGQISRLHAAGIPMLVGTDAGFENWIRHITPGVMLHHALVGLVLGGLTPLEALQTVTLNPALALRATDSLGTVAAGKVADLVLLDADPLVDIWHTTRIRGVVANGRYYDRVALDHLLAEAERMAAQR